MRCLVLGGGGFLGKNLVDSLERKGYFVRSFDRALNEKRGGASEEKSASNVEHFSGNFLARSDIETALNGIDVCFHLISTTIASTSNANPTFDVETNLLGTLQLLKCAVKSGVKRIVFISSGGTVYGVPKTIPISEEHSTYPTSSYGITKLACYREVPGSLSVTSWT